MAVPSSRDVPTKLRYFLRDAPRNPELFGGAVDFVAVKKTGKPATKTYDHTVLDGRAAANGGIGSWTLEEHGFTFIPAPQGVSDFKDPKLDLGDYQSRVVEAVKKATGAKQAFWMSHMRRSEEVKNTGTGGYATLAHSDFGPLFEPLFRKTLVARYGVPEEEAKVCGLLLVNFWAPIHNPAYKDPLALLDASSVGDLGAGTVPFISTGNLGYPAGYTGKGPDPKKLPVASQDAPAVVPVYDPRHRWVYFPDMLPSEAVIFKQYDFRPEARAKASFHHSFPDTFHDAWKECPPRRSIECRVILTFDPQPGKSSKL